MTTSPYDTLPTGKQAFAPASSESIETQPPIPGNPAMPTSGSPDMPDPISSAKTPAAVPRQSTAPQSPAVPVAPPMQAADPEFLQSPHPQSSPQAPNPITDPYGGYEEISLEEAARLAAPAMSQSTVSSSMESTTGNTDAPASPSGNGGPTASLTDSSNNGEPAASANDPEPAKASPGITNSTPATPTTNAPPTATSPDTGRSDVISAVTAPRNDTSPEGAPLDAELHYDTIRLRNRQRTWNYILPFEETLLVPDTMPDMGQILFSEGRATASQPGKTHYSSGDTYSGEILLFTVYRPDGADESPVDVVRSTIAFQTDACWGSSGTRKNTGSQGNSRSQISSGAPDHTASSQSEHCSYNATVRLKETETTRLNERKFQVRGTLCITITEIRKAELRVLRDAADPDLILRQDSMSAADLVFETEEFADVEQEIAVEEGQPRPARILKESFAITETHRQVTSGKLIINGMLQTQILYLGEDDEGESRLCSRSEKTEFTQFIPLQSPLDSNFIKVDFGDDGLKLTIENQDTFQLEGQVRIQIHGYGNKQIPVVSDAYHKEKSIGFERKEVPLSCLNDVLSGEISAREVVSLTEQEQHPYKLLCGSILPGDISARREHGRIVIEGSVSVRILALDENGRAFVIESEVPLRGALDTSADTSALKTADLFACSAIKDFWIDAINSRQIEINVSATIEVWISGTRDFASLENFTASEETPQQPAMAIYITSSGDSLWDIAKRYQCDTDALVQLNQIDGDAPLPEGTKLLIVR